MILYVDETENNDYFLVAGLLIDTEENAELTYKHFKKKIRDFKIDAKYKSKIFVEFKSVLIDYDYQRVKIKMLEEISNLKGRIIFSMYDKNGVRFNQVLKESVYITLLSKILNEIEDNCDTVIFDEFGNKRFEENIVKSIVCNTDIENASPGNSQKVHGLQFVDNICSVIRHHIADDECDDYFVLYYKIIEKMITEV